MRIISKFHDYYDVGQRYYSDDIIFERETIEYSIDKLKLADKLSDVINQRTKYKIQSYYAHNRKAWNIWFDRNIISGYYIIGFCGKIFKCIEVNVSNSDIIGDREDRYFYSKTDIKNFIDKVSVDVRRHTDLDKFIASFIPPKRRKWYNDDKYDWLLYDPIEYKEVFIENRCPIFVIDAHKGLCLLNDQLEKYEFYRIFDPITAYQELSMFMGSAIPAQERDMVEIEEKYRYAQKGFDVKYGFRKRPKI